MLLFLLVFTIRGYPIMGKVVSILGKVVPIIWKVVPTMWDVVPTTGIIF